MNKFFILMILVVCGYFSAESTYAQEEKEFNIEQSAAVFLEEYSDTFQEFFFDGLKQKGIQNYDRAIDNFLECQRLQPDNEVVSFELAKAYLLDKEPMLAQEAAIKAVKANPENYWFAGILIDILDMKKTEIEELQERIEWKNETLRKNIAEIYFKKERYQTAISVLKGLGNSKNYAELENRILEALAKQQQIKESKSFSMTIEKSEAANNANQYKSRLKFLIESETSPQLILQIAEEAMENYPAQPYFYYANGYALNRTGKNRGAIEILETGLDYLISNISLENKIYKELADAYTAISNPAKADMYTRKIKPGF